MDKQKKKKLENQGDPIDEWPARFMACLGAWDKSIERPPQQSLDEIRDPFDWMLVLPKAAERKFPERVKSLKENPRMRYVTSIERLARQEGLEQGRQEGRKGQAALILRLLELRFGELAPEHLELLNGASLEQLSRWGERVFTSRSLDEIFAAD